MAVLQGFHHSLGDAKVQGVGLRAPDHQSGTGDPLQGRPEVGSRSDVVVAPLLPNSQVVAPTDPAAGQFLCGVGQTPAQYRFRCETVLAVHVLENGLEGLELLGDLLDFPGDAGGAPWVQVRADVHYNQVVQPFRVASREGHTVASTHGVTDQGKRFQAQGIAESLKVGDKRAGGIVAARGPIGLSPATLVQGQHLVVLAEPSRNIVPGMAVTAQAVQQHHHRLAFVAPVQVVNIQAVGGDHPVPWLH